MTEFLLGVGQILLWFCLFISYRVLRRQGRILESFEKTYRYGKNAARLEMWLDLKDKGHDQAAALVIARVEKESGKAN